MINNYATGAKICWAVVPDYLLPRIMDVKTQMCTIGNSGVELIANEMLAEGYYYEFLKEFRQKLPARIEQTDAILNKYLKGIAVWNPDNILYTVLLEFDKKIDTDAIIRENPYFLISGKANDRKNCIHTNGLGMSTDDFENLVRICAKSVKNQQKNSPHKAGRI